MMPHERARLPATARHKAARKGQQRCYPLEPVHEDRVMIVEVVMRKPKQEQKWKGRGGVLTRLRDGYVKLMNDMASSADFAGVSAAYGCSTSHLEFLQTAAAKQEKEAGQTALVVHNSVKNC